MRFFLVFGAVLGAVSIFLDAFFSHGLIKFLGEGYSIEKFFALKAASKYQLCMSIFLIVLYGISQIKKSIALLLSQILCSLGVVLFCGAIYLKILWRPVLPGIIAPIGGSLMAVSFIVLVFLAPGKRLLREKSLDSGIAK